MMEMLLVNHVNVASLGKSSTYIDTLTLFVQFI